LRAGVLRADLHIPHAHSLKEKRACLKRLMGRLQSRFNVSIAEVGAQDLHQRGVVGVAIVAADGEHLARQLDAVEEFIRLNPDLPVLDISRKTLGNDN
jgi:uncharacterized protein YlxP (DUF503 family)